ncbi:hypothetical protein KC336_g18 [Hortaea werneckii]|nr:hypothetical protein KC336_g18 [Hortaea werneckii]
MSVSQPCRETSRMLARGARMRLDKREIRIKTLETHTDHGIWKDTPYISFSNCPQSLKELANYRSIRRGRAQRWLTTKLSASGNGTIFEDQQVGTRMSSCQPSIDTVVSSATYLFNGMRRV